MRVRVMLAARRGLVLAALLGFGAMVRYRPSPVSFAGLQANVIAQKVVAVALVAVLLILSAGRPHALSPTSELR